MLTADRKKKPQKAENLEENLEEILVNYKNCSK